MAPVVPPDHASLDIDSRSEETVQSTMTFLKRDGLWAKEKPYRMRYEPTGSIPRTNVKLEALPVTLRDMRPSLKQLSLDKNGFEVHLLTSALEYEDFLDHDKVTRVYMRELGALVKRVCKAKHVFPLDYEVVELSTPKVNR